MEIKYLIKNGKQQDYLELEEVMNVLPEELTDQEQIEDILQMIEDMGIPIRWKWSRGGQAPAAPPKGAAAICRLVPVEV